MEYYIPNGITIGKNCLPFHVFKAENAWEAGVYMSEHSIRF